MQRPTAFYPEAPKLAFFNIPRNHVTNVSLHGGNAGNGANSVGPVPPSFSNVAVAPMSATQYGYYLAAHQKWIDAVKDIDRQLHDEAIVKRFLESQKEEALLKLGMTGDPLYREIPLGRGYVTDFPAGKFPAQLKVKSKGKKLVPPTLSTKPHEAEKRDKKKKLRDARAKAQAEVLQARIDVVAGTNASDVKDRMLEVKKIADLKPLWKAEESAAKSASIRSKAIKFGSTDIATNIAPSDGWKVVTRAKGAVTKQSQISETIDAATGSKTVVSFVDAALPSGVPLLASVRLPTAVGANK